MSSLTWIDTNGTSTVLDVSTGFRFLTGGVGLDVPPVELSTEPYLSFDGSVLVKRRRGQRRVALPLYINTGGTVSTAVGQAAAFFQGPGTLRYTGVNTRDLINVIYEAGMEGDWSDQVAVNETWRKLVVSLLALDPWWYGSTDTVAFQINIQVAFDDAATAFDAAISFDAASTNPILVEGDVSAFPVTTIVGPFTTLQVGLSGGQSFALADPLAGGDIITVDTRPGSRGPSRNGGAVDWSLLTPASRLWELEVGTSVMDVAATGESGSSGIEMSWRERWLTP